MKLMRSMALRFALSLGLIAAVVYTAVGVLIYQALASELRRADQESLSGKAQLISHLVLDMQPALDMAALTHLLDDSLIGHKDLHVWLLSSAGSVVYGKTPLPMVESTNAQGALHMRMSNGSPMLGRRFSTNGITNSSIHTFLLAIDIAPQQRFLASYRKTLILICLLGIGLTLCLGLLASWYGLLPIKRLSKAADLISPHSLEQRLPTAQVDLELVALSSAFNGVLDRLERAYRQLETFNANVAHELRTPLNTLINGAQITLLSDRSSAQLRETLGAGLEDLERLKSVVNDMLFLARADQGDKATSLSQVDLADEVSKSIDYLEPLLHEAGVSAQCLGQASARCNASLIRRALINLLSNALKHTERGQIIEVRIEQSAQLVRLSVTNPGPPLPPLVVVHMFDRFYRADEARTQSGESTGLGLAIVRAVAQMHHGDVFAHSQTTGVTVGFSVAA
ncbi:MAG: heavy metal sensor histidine kinase [Burkholderiales bacterium]